ncbi:MAG: CRISPR-associated protein [Prevotella sp.]|nr:CRISPR-associated protein [Prevotella sp.]
MLLNFSNHPSSLWEERQVEATRQYGEIADMPFPSIDPGVSSETVKEMAKSYVHDILQIAKNHDVTVHVMGEMTFVFSVVTQLEEKGIRCVASTTERIVKDNDDGTKTSEFSFVGFREY